MTADEITRQLAGLFKRRTERLRAPTPSEWEALRASLNWTWPDEFFQFHRVVGEYWFEGDLLGVAQLDDSDTIAVARDTEVEVGNWPDDLVPFLAVGNGDYFCLSRREGGSSRVYYVFHEGRRVDVLHDSFANWLLHLDEYYGK
jgi:hypothetical protein